MLLSIVNENDSFGHWELRACTSFRGHSCLVNHVNIFRPLEYRLSKVGDYFIRNANRTQWLLNRKQRVTSSNPFDGKTFFLVYFSSFLVRQKVERQNESMATLTKKRTERKKI